jgi:hypothetical protein
MNRMLFAILSAAAVIVRSGFAGHRIFQTSRSGRRGNARRGEAGFAILAGTQSFCI